MESSYIYKEVNNQMSNNNSQPNHKNHKKKFTKSTYNSKKKYPASSLKLVIFENSIASQSSDADIKRAAYLFNNIQRQIIKTRISRIHLN